MSGHPVRAVGQITAVSLLVALALAGCGGGGETPGPPAVAADEAGLSRLEVIGKRLFFDTSLSNPAGQSCGSCHDPETGFSGNFGSDVGVPLAADKVTLGVRNTPTAAYASFTPPFTLTTVGATQVAHGGQFLDGRAASLEEQAGMPLFAGGEMNIASPAELATRLADAPYAALMREEFGAAIFASPKLVLRSVQGAIAAFERTPRFAPFSSKFDNALVGDATLSALDGEGLKLFTDPLAGDCTRCHVFDRTSASASKRLFTDFGYYNLGVPRNARIPANADPAFFDLGLCGPRRERVGDDRLCGAFKVPTLRNVTRRAAFMHNGVFTSLRDAVAFHARRDIPADDVPEAYRANVMPAVSNLDERGIDAITAFLGTLEDGFGASRIPDGK
jgi:cytochrome c peroxidase